MVVKLMLATTEALHPKFLKYSSLDEKIASISYSKSWVLNKNYVQDPRRYWKIQVAKWTYSSKSL